jgi:hypothetical protein
VFVAFTDVKCSIGHSIETWECLELTRQEKVPPLHPSPS